MMKVRDMLMVVFFILALLLPEEQEENLPAERPLIEHPNAGK